MSQAPAAITIVLKKNWSMWMSFHALDRFAQSMPFGHSANGCVMVSCDGVTAALRSHRIGPRPATTSVTKRNTCTTRMANHVPGRRRSESETIERSDSSVMDERFWRRAASQARSPSFRTGGVVSVTTCSSDR